LEGLDRPDAEDVLEFVGNRWSCSIDFLARNAELDRGGVGGHGMFLLVLSMFDIGSSLFAEN
jgi:hypothetical protein